MENNILGKNIAFERKRQGMTQEQLAEFSDLTINYLSKVERGVAKKISADSLFKIARALNISMDSLFTADSCEGKVIKKGPYQRQLDKYFSELGYEKTEIISKHFLEILRVSSRD